MTNTVLIDQKGIFLGNPLRYLDCAAEDSWGTIHRAYNEISKVRLRTSDRYTPRNDPFTKIDPMVIDQSNARRAFELLRDLVVRAASKLLYPSRRGLIQSRVIEMLQAGANEYLLTFSSQNSEFAEDATIAIAEYVVLFCSPGDRRDVEILKRPLHRLTVLLTGERVKRFILDDADLRSNSLVEKQVSDVAWEFLLTDYWHRGIDTVIAGHTSVGDDRLIAISGIIQSTFLLPLSNEIACRILDDRCKVYIRPLINSMMQHTAQVEKFDSKREYVAFSRDIVENMEKQLSVPKNLKKTYADRFNQLQYELDDLARSLRSYGIAIYNKWDDFVSSLHFIQLARFYANTPDLQERLDEDYRTIKHNQSVSPVTQASHEAGDSDYRLMPIKKAAGRMWVEIFDFLSATPLLIKIVIAALVLGFIGKQCGDDDAQTVSDKQQTQYRSSPSSGYAPGSMRSSQSSTRDNSRAGGAAPPVTQSSAGNTYIVKRGDTMWDIAKRHGVTVDILRMLNGFSRTSQIYVGQKLIVGVASSGGRSDVTALGEEIDSDKLSLYGLKREITALDSELELSSSEIDAMLSTLQTYEGMLEAGVGSVETLYSQLYDNYERSVNAHNAKVSERQELYEEYEDLRLKINNKIEIYNASIRR